MVSLLFFRSKSGGIKNRSSEGDIAHTNKVFDKNVDLPDNPLYLSSQPVDELGYSSDQEKQLGLPPTDSKTKKKINSDYDFPPNNKPIADGTSSMPVYAVPKRSQDRTPEASTGDVYAEVCKPNRSTGKDPVRKRNEDGLLFMEAEQVTAATKQTNTKDKHEITEVFFVTAKGQCPSIDEKSLITSCDGSKKDGPAVFADFYEIKRPCTCIVTPSFVGELLVTSKKVIISSCNTRVSVSSGIIFGCPLSSVLSQTFIVKINQTVNVQAEYIPPSATGTFYHCVGFQQNGGLNGNLSVKCEPPANTTISLISTTTSTIPQLSHGASSTESSISVVNANKNAGTTIHCQLSIISRVSTEYIRDYDIYNRRFCCRGSDDTCLSDQYHYSIDKQIKE
uniref:Uncharacterized protein n=1 Tax=Magallana gigas TaxID=29159 RepID=A0A8W8JGD8_MAGGI